MKLKLPDIQKWQQRLLEHPLLQALESWTKTHSLPGFFSVPIYDVLLFVWKEIQRDDLFTRANSVAYSFFLSLFPSLIALFTLAPVIKQYLLSYLPEGENFETLLYDEIHKVMPGVAGDRVFNFIEDITNNPRVGLLSIGFFMALYFASNGMIMLMRGFDKSYSHTFKERGWFRKRLIAMGLVLQLGGLIVTSAILIILGKLFITLIDDFIKLDRFSEIALNLTRWLAVIALFYFSIAVIYRFGAATRRKFKFFTPGAMLATLLSLVASIAFSAYVNNFNTYNELYGSIGTIIILMIWIQMNSLFLLIGYELNASIAVNRDMRKQIVDEMEGNKA